MVHPDDGRRSEIVMDAAGRSCEVDEEDYISGLPDDLLHNILLRLRSTAAAARTSVLSRRWLRVWAHLPDLELGNFRAPAAAVDSVLDSIDAAMAASQAPAIDSLCITVEKENRTRQLPLAAIPAHRVIAWLRFASRRRVRRRVGGEEKTMEALPIDLLAMERATSIVLDLGHRFRLRLMMIPPPVAGGSGAFTKLTALTIIAAAVESRELEALVSSHCPRLERLSIIGVKLLGGGGAASSFSIRSDSLTSLYIHLRDSGLEEVVAPRLEKLHASGDTGFHVAAPMLAEVSWQDVHRAYLSNGVRRRPLKIAGAARSLRRLCITSPCSVGYLLQRFDAVDWLDLTLAVPQGVEAYRTFMDDMDNLPKCETLVVALIAQFHGFVPSMLHLLRRCSHVKKLVVMIIEHRDPPPLSPSSFCSTACPCRSPDIYKTDGIALDCLEEVEIRPIGSAPVGVVAEFVDQIFRLDAAMLKKVVYQQSPFRPDQEGYEKVRSMYLSNPRIEFRQLASTTQSKDVTVLCSVNQS
ncbi:putative F-box/LRR-repeat protein At5g02700 [Oryza glaberrima]|uniref:putative F-box/LRR-repeat protein At5g02700 n=1 Tax=Oryza glaberrima TaxID=4538 RepID=UPI00224C2053|nr:putative F-box/LRR-repeat protein At5g02700 [Oryza glaberrima]